MMLSHEHVDSLADDVLLRNIGQGSTDCFALLFHRYCRLVFSVSYRIIRDKAETEDIPVNPGPREIAYLGRTHG